jgi:hypothetical protein
MIIQYIFHFLNFFENHNYIIDMVLWLFKIVVISLENSLDNDQGFIHIFIIAQYWSRIVKYKTNTL